MTMNRETLEPKIKALLGEHDSMEWDNPFRRGLCELTFRTNKHNSVLCFGFDADGFLIPSMSSGPNLRTLRDYTVVFTRALAIIDVLGLKYPE